MEMLKIHIGIDFRILRIKTIRFKYECLTYRVFYKLVSIYLDQYVKFVYVIHRLKLYHDFLGTCIDINRKLSVVNYCNIQYSLLNQFLNNITCNHYSFPYHTHSILIRSRRVRVC